jgi:hypothetical protein
VAIATLQLCPGQFGAISLGIGATLNLNAASSLESKKLQALVDRYGVRRSHPGTCDRPM